MHGVQRGAHRLGHAHHAADDQHVLGRILPRDGVPKREIELGGHVADILAAGGVAVFPRCGKGVFTRAQLLDVPGNGGLGHIKAAIPQVAQELVLGIDVVLFDKVPEFSRAVEFSWGGTIPFWQCLFFGI